MRANPSSAGAEDPAFPVTRWSLIGRVGQPTSAEQRAALGQLLQRYLPALRAHLVLERRMTHEHAEDLLQGFVAQKVLEQRLIDRSDASRGKFRTFLLRSLNHFAIDVYRREQAEKRSAAVGPPVSIEDVLDPPDTAEPKPSEAFDRAWAKEVLAEAVRRMRRECDASGRVDLWGVFEGRVLAPSMDGAEPVSYETLLAQYRFASPGQASNILITAKRTFARLLRSIVAEYAEDEKEVDEELSELANSLRKAGGS